MVVRHNIKIIKIWEASWSFFATSHGKSPCDGIGGTVKRLATAESLRRPMTNLILSVNKMFDFCVEKIAGIEFTLITKEEMIETRDFLKKRFDLGHAIPGTRSFHHFVPESENVIQFKRTSEDEMFSGNFSFLESPAEECMIRKCDYVACKYDHAWWIAVIMEINEEENDYEVHFLHPKGPSKKFFWPYDRDDICLILRCDIMCVIEVPFASSMMARTYTISEEDYRRIIELYEI